MGCGIYVVWPVFYTDITDSYRLGRGGRLRTDLGGIYFNGLFIAALTAGYRLSGFAPLAVAVIAINLEIIQQLLPSIRFDAYYIVSDLIGVPDLFRYIAPMVRRVLLRAPDEQLGALKRAPKIIIGIWVFGVIPAGLVQLGMLIWRLPRFVATGEQTAGALLHAGQAAAGNGNLTGLASAALQMLSAVLPLAGIILLALRTLIGTARLTRRLLPGGGAAAAAAAPARGRHAGVPRHGTWGTASRGRHAADRYRGVRRVNGRGGHSINGHELLTGGSRTGVPGGDRPVAAAAGT
jgi:putative peptide zinc metalloprotease protein